MKILKLLNILNEERSKRTGEERARITRVREKERERVKNKNEKKANCPPGFFLHLSSLLDKKNTNDPIFPLLSSRVETFHSLQKRVISCGEQKNLIKAMKVSS